jgi:hypothetical protein
MAGVSPALPMKALLTWFLVAVPLTWGITKSVQKSLPLFKSTPAAAGAKP